MCADAVSRYYAMCRGMSVCYVLSTVTLFVGMFANEDEYFCE